MKLTFLGTKGYIEESTKRHRYHSSLLIEYKGYQLLIDHGLLSHPLKKIKPYAILITHAHPDTFKWIKENEEYAGRIYVTRQTRRLSKFKKKFVILKLNKWFSLGPFEILSYSVIHSLRAPAIGFKIKANKTIIYNSDLVVMKNKNVLRDVDVYIGDGSSVKGNLVRNLAGKIFGHSKMSTQINWCKQYGIKNIIFTHLGKEALALGDLKLEKMLKQEGMKIKIAYDKMKIFL